MVKRKLTYRMLLLALMLIVVFAQTSLASVFYKFDVIAQTGQRIGQYELIGIDDGPSINDNGTVAFIGQLAGASFSNEAVFVGSGPGHLTNFTPGFVSPNRRFSPAVQINNAEQVVAQNQGLGASGRTWIRIWNSIDIYTPIASGKFGVDDFDAVFSYPSMNDNGDVVFSAIGQACPDKCLVTPSASGFNVELLQTPVRPFIGDSGHIVVRAGNQPTDPILLYNNNLRSSTTIAGAGWNLLGRSPGVSAPLLSVLGNIVVFAGDRGNGPGIFASIDDGSGSRILERIAGENSGPSGPRAELGFDDENNPLFFQSFDIDSRVGITHSTGLQLDESFVVSFIATPNAAPSPPPRNPIQRGLTSKPGLTFSNQKGIWTVRVDVKRDGGVSLIVNTPIPVVQIGDGIQTSQASFAIDNFSVYDPIAKGGTDNVGDHRVVFWASGGAEQFIVRASHLNACLLSVTRLAQGGGARAPWRNNLYDTHPQNKTIW